MPRLGGTSVRDRVMAFEKTDAVENAVVRARHVPDVRGVNRYKHFHTPNEPSTSPSPSKDGPVSLPFLIRPGQANLCQKKLQNKRKDFRMHFVGARDEDNGVEKGNRKKSRNVTLPQLGNATTNCKSPRKSHREADLVDQIDEHARAAVKTSSESDTSTKSNHSGRLNDHLTAKSVNFQSTGKRTFATLGTRQNGIIISKPLENNSLEVSLPPRSKSSQDLEARAEPSDAPPSPPFGILGSQSNRDLRDMATQTISSQTSTSFSTTSVEFLDPASHGQTTHRGYLVAGGRRKSQLEEREMLMDVIEDALGETFDRYSRVRTNQIIANSARKQAQIWRDAKDFLVNQLLPQSIQLANTSTSRRQTAAEIVANIKMYP